MLAAGQQVGELVDRHLRPLARSVDREEAQAGGAQAVEVAVVEAEQLAAAFGGGVGADRQVDAVVFGEGHLFVDAVDRRGGAEDEVGGTVVAGRLEQAQGADAVDVFVEDRLLEAGPHPGPGRQVHHPVEAAPAVAVLARAVFAGAVLAGEQ